MTIIGPKSFQSDQRWFPIYNDSGEEIPPFSIVELKSATRDEVEVGNGTRYTLYAKVRKPTGITRKGLAVTGMRSIPASGHGEATQHLPTWVSYDTGTPAAFEIWGPENGEWAATKTPIGPFQVIGSPIDESGIKRVLVTANRRALVVGKTDYAIAKGASGTISLYSGTSTTLSDTTWNVSAYLRLGAVGSGKWVYIHEFPWGFEVVNAEC